MYKIVMIYIILYLLTLFFSCVSEITYRKKVLKDVVSDFKRIWWRSSLIFVVFLISSILYFGHVK